MSDIPTTSNPTAGAAKDPDEWVTGDEAMTGPQASYLATLAHDAGRDIPETMTKAEASKLIDELRGESDRVGPQVADPFGRECCADSIGRGEVSGHGGEQVQ